jgi:histidine triad (HIT) family protein
MPLLLPKEDPCSFCAYLAGDRPYTVLEHCELTALLVTFEQRGLGHLLVVPTAHRVTLFDLSEEETMALSSATTRAAAAIRDAFDPEGIVIWQNNGVPASQSVPHVHVHVAGTVPGGGTISVSVPRLSVRETDAIADRLRAHLPAE